MTKRCSRAAPHARSSRCPKTCSRPIGCGRTRSRSTEACDDEYRPLAELLIGGGPRISEALAIEVDDIDADRQVIYVLRQARKGATAKRGGRRRCDVARTKGKNYRQVAVSRRVINVLLQHIARQSARFPMRGDSRVFVRYRPPPPEAIAMTPAARAPRGDRR